MADMTDREEERGEQPQPFIKANIDKLAPLVGKDGQIAKIEERKAKAQGELGNLYQKIEKEYHGNRKAVKLARQLEAGTTDAAYDFMRTFIPLCQRLGLMPEDDLVDGMMNEPRPAVDDEPGVSAGDLAPKSERGKPALKVVESNAIDRAQAAMKGGTKPPAPKGPPGDNDLADAGSDVADDIQRQKSEDAEAFDAIERERLNAIAGSAMDDIARGKAH